MKNKKNILIGLAILLLGLLLGWLIKPSNNENDDSAHQHDELSEDQIWTCSMHPEIRRNEPGDCPICGMDLIPIDEEEASADPEVYQMSENAMKLANITTMKVGKSNASKELRLNGKVQVNERNAVSQSSHIPGRIERLNVNTTGERVNRGQTLAIIYSPEMINAQQELLQASEIKESQPELFEAAKEKLRNWRIGENQINQILSSGRALENFPIIADVSGVVTEKMVDLGDYVERGMPIYEIADLSMVWVLFDLYENQLGWVQEGSKVEYTVSSLPGETFEGEISFIDPLLNAQSRVAQARVEVDNRDGRLKPEMFVSGTVENEIGNAETNEIVIPKSAVLWTGKRSLVYIKEPVENGGGFRIREVTLGPSLGDAYVIEEGLQTGEEIVVNGTFTVDAAVQLSGRPSMMNPQFDDDSKEEVEVNQIDLSAEEKEQFQIVLKEYLALKDALVNDDFNTAKEKISVLENEIQDFETKNLDGDSAGGVNNYKNELEKGLDAMTSAENISELRNEFDELSTAMINMTKSFRAFEEKLYVQHCPMANDNKGANWLSLSEEIRNPYFGSEMLNCGEVTGEI